MFCHKMVGSIDLFYLWGFKPSIAQFEHRPEYVCVYVYVCMYFMALNTWRRNIQHRQTLKHVKYMPKCYEVTHFSPFFGLLV